MKNIYRGYLQLIAVEAKIKFLISFFTLIINLHLITHDLNPRA